MTELQFSLGNFNSLLVNIKPPVLSIIKIPQEAESSVSGNGRGFIFQAVTALPS